MKQKRTLWEGRLGEMGGCGKRFRTSLDSENSWGLWLLSNPNTYKNPIYED